jgi:hypothetical protein
VADSSRLEQHRDARLLPCLVDAARRVEEHHIVSLPKGLSRHLVRFANLSGRRRRQGDDRRDGPPRVRHARLLGRLDVPVSNGSR